MISGKDTSFSDRVMKYEVESAIKLKLSASGTKGEARKTVNHGIV